MKTHQSVVAGIDFSPASMAALQAATRLASRSGAKVTALHVIDEDSAGELQERLGLSDAALIEQLCEKLTTFCSDASAHGCSIEFKAVVGQPFTALISTCQQVEASLLVLGACGTTHKWNQVGALASSCIGDAPLDVLIVRQDQDGPFNRILACVDLSLSSQLAVEEACLLARDEHAEVDCLFISEAAPECRLPRETHLPLPIFDRRSETAASARDRLSAFLSPLLASEREVHWNSVVSERANVGTGILDYLRSRSIDLVVLGCRRHEGLSDYTAGATVQDILRSTACAVLTVRPPVT